MTNEREPTELEAAIATLPEGTIKYEATFVPYSKVSAERKKSWGGSRDGKPVLFLSWVVTINGESFDYSAGIGHISNERIRKAAMKSGWTIHDKAAVEAWVDGKTVSIGGSYHMKPVVPQKPPALADVLSGLLLDAGALDESFEDWAGNYGYDVDSRTAEKTYKECRDSAYRFVRAIGANTLEELRGKEH